MNQVKGIREQISASRDSIRETLVGSKFEILKNESKEAFKRAKAMHKMNHEEWKSVIRRRDLKVEVELGESQLHSVVGRLKEVMRKQQSTDLQGAVIMDYQRFVGEQVPLRMMPANSACSQ